MERYYGTLMYCTFLPFSIHAPSEKEALAEMQKLAPQALSEEEKRELSAHLTRIPQADRVMVINKGTQNAKKPTHKRSPLAAH
jgi:hypothetical protein